MRPRRWSGAARGLFQAQRRQLEPSEHEPRKAARQSSIMAFGAPEQLGGLCSERDSRALVNAALTLISNTRRALVSIT
jgi:hypothetical protein